MFAKYILVPNSIINVQNEILKNNKKVKFCIIAHFTDYISHFTPEKHSCLKKLNCFLKE